MNCSEGLFERVAEELVTRIVIGAVAAPDFAVHDGRANRLLGMVVCGFDIRLAQEREVFGGVAAGGVPDASVSSSPAPVETEPLPRPPSQGQRTVTR